MVITRVGALSAAKVAGILHMAMGLAFGAIFSLISVAGGLASNQEVGGLLGMLIGAGAIIAFPIFYGCMGFVMTLIMAALFNVAAGIVGGVEVDAR